MDKILKSGFSTSQVDVALLILRIGVAGLMLTHGLPKLQMLFAGGEIQFPGMFGLSPLLTVSLAVFAEVVCSLLLLVGLGTRVATIPLIITMLIAVFMFHANDPFASKELGLLYLLVYLPLLLLGGGKYSVERMLSGRHQTVTA